MDNLSRFYFSRYMEAKRLAVEGKIDDAKDILFDLRLKHNIGVYIRCRAVLLLAALSTVDVQKYLDEATACLQELKKSGFSDPADLKGIENIEDQIAMVQKEWDASPVVEDAMPANENEGVFLPPTSGLEQYEGDPDRFFVDLYKEYDNVAEPEAENSASGAEDTQLSDYPLPQELASSVGEYSGNEAMSSQTTYREPRVEDDEEETE